MPECPFSRSGSTSTVFDSLQSNQAKGLHRTAHDHDQSRDQATTRSASLLVIVLAVQKRGEGYE
jgi:hypothetical protein